MAVSGLGEFDLIERLAALVAGPPAPGLAVGIGDDAAAWTTEPNVISVATADALVEGVHFDLATTGWRDLGWKALAENVSDVAAMGCLPRYAFVTLALPAATPLAGVEELYRGMGECAQAYGCAIAGGDVVRAPYLTLSVTLIGMSTPAAEVTEGRILRRSSAQPGDVIAVTGSLGGSAAGLKLLLDGWRDSAHAPRHARTAAERSLVQLHRRPIPRVAAGQALVAAGVRCAIDVSDGLVADVGHICERSSVDAELNLEAIPVHPDATLRFGAEALEMALTGGEDYELVCAGAMDHVARASERLVEQGEAALTIIGTIVSRAGARPRVAVRDRHGVVRPILQGGYRHF